MKRLQWLIFVVFVLCNSIVHAQWLYTDLHPSWSSYSTVMAVSAGDQVGYGMDNNNKTHALRWQFAPSTVIDLGGANSYAWATDGSRQVGYKGLPAVRWIGSPNGVVSLRKPSYSINSIATTMFGQTYGGYSYISSPRQASGFRGVYWPSLTSNPIVLNGPAPFSFSSIFALSNDFKGGEVNFYQNGVTIVNAATWEGPSNTFVNRNPPGYMISTIRGMDDQIAVGWASETEDFNSAHAFLWSLDNNSFWDLHPYQYYASWIFGMSGSIAAGTVWDYNGYQHAVIWDLYTGQVTDLQQFLPANYNSSGAFAVWVGQGCGGYQVGGWATSQSDGKVHAMLWYTPFC